MYHHFRTIIKELNDAETMAEQLFLKNEPENDIEEDGAEVVGESAASSSSCSAAALALMGGVCKTPPAKRRRLPATPSGSPPPPSTTKGSTWRWALFACWFTIGFLKGSRNRKNIFYAYIFYHMGVRL